MRVMLGRICEASKTQSSHPTAASFGTHLITTRTGEEYIILCYPSGSDMGRSYAFLDENGVILTPMADDAVTRQISWDAVKKHVDSGIVRIVRFDTSSQD